MENIQIIDLTPENIGNYGVCGYKDAKKHKELQNKINWFSRYYAKGLRIKAIITEQGGYQGMIEYIPGEFAHRPVDAQSYMFIHCVFVGFKKAYKGKGYASRLIEACINDAKDAGMQGVAVVTRKGSFMAKSDIFLKSGFKEVDRATPDFKLLALQFGVDSDAPAFKSEIFKNTGEYAEGLTILRSPQCPYTEKNVHAILETATKTFELETRLIDLEDADAAQKTPSPFGTFCIIHDGEIISHHPISNTRFENIMKKRMA